MLALLSAIIEGVAAAAPSLAGLTSALPVPFIFSRPLRAARLVADNIEH